MKKTAITFLFCATILSGYSQISICNNPIWATDTISNSYINGLVYYSAETRTLTLDNAQIDVPWPNEDHITNVLFLPECQLEIHLIGENAISGIFPINLARSNCVISGPGKLTLSSLNWTGCCGVYSQELSTLSIRNNAEVIIFANNQWNTGAGFRGRYYDWNDTTIVPQEQVTEYAGKVFVNSATLRINSDMCVYRLEDFRLDSCHFSSPENAYFDSDLHTVVSSGQMVQGYLEVVPGEVNVPENCQIQELVWCGQGVIFMEKLTVGQVIEIYNTLGQRLASFKAPSSAMQVPMKPGIYIVRFQNHSQKVVVY